MAVPRAVDEEAIYLTLSEALLSGRLAPGAKLGEHKLAAFFGVTRERIRKVLHRLGHERLIEVIPNRGAFVANPGLDDARQIYEARRIVEGGITWQLAQRLSAAQLAALRTHLVAEERAHAEGARAEAIRLSGAFHVLLAEMSRNDLVVRQMQELVSRTSMLVALFEEETTPSCGIDEHVAILQALESRNPAAAAQAMTAHLSLIETRLHPRPTQPPPPDADKMLRAALRRPPAPPRAVRKPSPPKPGPESPRRKPAAGRRRGDRTRS